MIASTTLVRISLRSSILMLYCRDDIKLSSLRCGISFRCSSSPIQTMDPMSHSLFNVVCLIPNHLVANQIVWNCNHLGVVLAQLHSKLMIMVQP